MNQTDYKEIARIIKECIVLDINKQTVFMISNKLAYYFEKDKPYILSFKKGDGFDKKQFLKDCGVKEVDEEMEQKASLKARYGE